MTTRFTIDGNDYDFLTDEVQIGAGSVRGSQYVMLDDTVTQDVIGLQLPVRVAGVFEQVAGPSISAGELWRQALTSAPLTLQPDTTRALTISIWPDLQSPPAPWYRTRKGIAQRGQRLAFVTTRLAPGSTALQEIAAYQDALQSQ